MIFHFRLFKLRYQIEEDIGSAEEQPISNRFDVHTKNEGSLICPFFMHFLVYPMAKENLFVHLIFIIQIPFQKVFSIGKT